MITNITEKQALDYLKAYANKETNGDFLAAMIKIKTELETEGWIGVPDIKLRVCFAIAFNGLRKFFTEPNEVPLIDSNGYYSGDNLTFDQELHNFNIRAQIE